MSIKVRKCNNCYFPLTHTEKVENNYRWWECDNCGKKYLWLNNPRITGAWATLHQTKDGGFSALSMGNDPDMHYPTRPQFVINKKGTKTHRYHYGKEEWVKII